MAAKKPQKHRARRKPPPRKPGTLGLERAERVVARIHGKLKARGYGKIRETEKKLKYTNGYISQIKYLGDIKLSVLYELMDELGISVESLLEGDEKVELEPTGSGPAFVRLVLAAEGAGLPQAKIAFLDELRFQSPTQTLSLITSLRSEISREQVASVLGIGASCYAQLFNFNAALWTIDAALTNSKKADLYLRKAYICSELGFLGKSRELVETAQRLAVEDFDLARIGESLTRLAFLEYKNANYRKATSLYLAALKYRTSLPPRKLCSLHQGLAFVYAADHRKEEAKHHFEDALRLAKETENSEYIAKTTWAMAFNQDSLDNSRRLLEQAVPLFPAHCAVDQALAVIDLANIYLTIGQEEGAKQCIRHAFHLLEHLAFIPEAAEAMSRLITEATNPMLESAVLVTSRKSIERARARVISLRAHESSNSNQTDRSRAHTQAALPE